VDRRIHRVGVIFGYDGELKLHTPFEFMVAVSTCIDAFWYIPEIGAPADNMMGLQRPLLLLAPAADSLKIGGFPFAHGPSPFPWFEEA